MSVEEIEKARAVEVEEARAQAHDRYVKSKRAKYVVIVVKHPDYSFERTKPENLVVYDGFEPKRNYLIIGKVEIRQRPDADLEWIRKDVGDKVSEIGGNAILITEKNFEKHINRVTLGDFNPKSLINYFEVSTEIERVSTIIYYGYVIRWIQD